MRFIDSSEYTEFKENYGKTMLCCWARINGYPIGIIANNGVIFIESARKATHFIQLANKSNIPLLFIHNTTGFMVGKKHEQNGMINAGSQLIMELEIMLCVEDHLILDFFFHIQIQNQE